MIDIGVEFVWPETSTIPEKEETIDKYNNLDVWK